MVLVGSALALIALPIWLRSRPLRDALGLERWSQPKDEELGWTIDNLTARYMQNGAAALLLLLFAASCASHARFCAWARASPAARSLQMVRRKHNVM